MCDSYSALLGWLSHARCPPPWPFSPGPGGHLPSTSKTNTLPSLGKVLSRGAILSVKGLRRILAVSHAPQEKL